MYKNKNNIIRPELNLTKYSDFIFPHSQTKDLDKSRCISWQKDNINCSIEISPIVNSTTPTSKSYKILLAIFIYLQQNNLDPFDEIPISLRKITSILGKSWNGRVVKEICQELRILKNNKYHLGSII